MTTLMPRGFGGFPTYQFSSPNQTTQQLYNNGLSTTGAIFSPSYSTQTLSKPFLSTTNLMQFAGYNQGPQASLGEEFLNLVNQWDDNYRNARYLRFLEKMRRRNLGVYTLPTEPYPYPPAPLYPPLPPIYSQTELLGFTTELGYEPVPSFINPGGMDIVPKVRVIFIPTGQTPYQQPCTGPLSMPPFLYNRVSQPPCAFPLPPPLPDIASMQITPTVQQMIMQRYGNPVAIFPYPSNMQIPQPMMYPAPQYPQEQYMMPTSALTPYPQPYTPPYPQPYTSPYPQPYTPGNIPILSPPWPQPSMPYSNAVSSAPQYPDNSYANTCRACPPAPPPLNIPVTGHCWVQHCCACHNVPTSDYNSRPTGGRTTPLLRSPTVSQCAPNQMGQCSGDFHANAPVMMRPWLRRTPPLPPGAILISDEYIDKKDAHLPFDYHKKEREYYRHPSYSKHRSAPAPLRKKYTISATNKKNTRSISLRRTNKNNNNSKRHRGSTRSESEELITSASGSSSGLSGEYEKITFYPPRTRQSSTSSESIGEAQNVNVQYNYQAQQVPTVNHLNRYLKSSSETSTISSKLDTVSSYSSSSVKKSRRVSPTISEFSSRKEDEHAEKIDAAPPRPPSRSHRPKEKLVITREFMTSSPSTVSTISSNMEFSIIDKDLDSISTTSTVKAYRLHDDDIPTREIF